MSFISNVGAKANITERNFQLVVKEVEGFIENISDYAVETVSTLTSDLHVPANNEIFAAAINSLHKMLEDIHNLNTTFKRQNWLKEQDFYFEVEEIELGHREEQVYSFQKKSMCSVLVSDKCYYIPIDKLLAKIVEYKNSEHLFRRKPNDNYLP